VPFTAFFPAGVADPDLISRLTSERALQGLLRHAVGGLQQVLRRGKFRIPPSVISATKHFRMVADPMRSFVDECVTAVDHESSLFVPRADVYQAYSVWSGVNGFHTFSASKFYEQFATTVAEVTNNPIKVVRVQGVSGYRRIELKQ